MKRYLLFLLALYFLSACQNSSNELNPYIQPDSPPKEKTSNKPANELYATHCISCHGAKGNLGVSGAKDLSQSILSKDGIIKQIWNGKNGMPPFKGVLSSEEADRLADFVLKLRPSPDSSSTKASAKTDSTSQ